MLARLSRLFGQINLLSDPALRHAWVYLRALYFIRVRRRLRVLDSQHAISANASHNLRSIHQANPRMRLLLLPLSTIETLDPATARILVIGPRNEYDLYTLVGLGFDLKRVVGLDLISYSPHIKLGDMHSIPFDDAAFDAVICGWTLSYSTNPQQAAREIARVTRPGGIVAIGVEYSTLDPEGESKLLGYQLQEAVRGSRINSTADIKRLFDSSIGHVYFEHDAPLKASHGTAGFAAKVSNVALLFGRSPS
jgi:SAM-dependent methyltransferase